MRITIVQGAFFPVPPLRGGAIEKAWHALGKEFARRGHQVTHISRTFQGLPEVALIEGVRHLRVSGYDQPQATWLIKILDFFYSLRARAALPPADILVTNTFWLPLLSRDAKNGAIYVHVGRYPHGQMQLYQSAARLQAVSHSVAEAIKNQTPKMADKVVVIPYPVADEMFVQSDSLPSVDQRDRCIIYAGRLHPEKGIGLLIHAFAQLITRGMPGWKLVVAGPWESELGGGGADYFKRLQGHAKTISNHVEFTGMLKDAAQLRAQYRKARLFVYPSLAEHGESFGLAPLEAMANGCPAMVSHLDCFKDFITDGANGFIFDHRRKDAVQALADRLAEAINDRDRLAAVGEKAAAKAREFTVARVADQLLADFQNVQAALSRARS